MSTLIIQSGAGSLTITRDPKSGLIAAKLKCWAANITDALFAPVPEFGIDRLVEWQPRTADRREAGEVAGYDVQITLEGHSDPDNAEEAEYSLDSTIKENPIDMHPNLGVLMKVYGGHLDPNTGRAMWDEKMPESSSADATAIAGFEEFGTAAGLNQWSAALTTSGLDIGADTSERWNPMHGVESYYVPQLTWTKKWVSNVSAEDTLTADIGTLIDNPPGNPPKLTGNRKWFVQRATSVRRGNCWQNTQTWMLVGPAGIAPELYPRS